MDIRQIALQTELERRPLYIERWKTWTLVQELTGEERGNLLEQCTNIVGKKAKVDLKKLYPMLAILSLRNPDQACLPDRNDPHYAQYPGAVDESGAYLTPPCEKPGELVFSLADLGPLSKKSGAILEKISDVASPLSGLRPEDIEEKKENLLDQGNIVESDGYTIA